MLRHYLLWVSSLFATSPNGVPGVRIPPLTDPSSGFLNLSTAFSAIWLASLFHPAATCRVRPVQGLLPSCSCLSHRETFCPHVVERTRAHRPRSAATLIRPDFEALIRTKKRCCSLGLTAQQLAPLFRFPSPPGSSPFSPWVLVPRDHPLLTSPAKVFDHSITSPSRLQRFPGEKMGWSVSRLPTCSRLSSLPLNRS